MSLFFAKAFAWTIKNPLLLFLAFLTIAGAVVVMGKNSDIAYLKGQLKVAEAARDESNRRLGICQGNATRILAAADRQNRAITDMVSVAAAREKQFDGVLDGIKSDRVNMGKTMADLLRRPAPADKCDGAFKLVKEVAK